MNTKPRSESKHSKPSAKHGSQPSSKPSSRPSSTGSRRKSREIVLQMLYQADLAKQTPDQVEKLFWTSREDVDEATRAFSSDLFRVASTRSETIDSLIVSHAKNWRLERMPAVDRNLLRMAIAEMLGYPRTPGPIVINEALEIAKRYAAPESMQFLNGVLDAVGQSLKVPAVLGPRKKTAPAE